MTSKYSFQDYGQEHMACALGRDLPISPKHSIEISSFLKGKAVLRGRDILGRVIEKKEAIPFRRFNGDVGHRKGMGPGRYPVKACVEILKILNSAIANAEFKGLNASDLRITHIAAQRGTRTMRQGRKPRRLMKRSTIEVVLEEFKRKKDTSGKDAKKQEKKPAASQEKKPQPKVGEKKDGNQNMASEKPVAPKSKNNEENAGSSKKEKQIKTESEKPETTKKTQADSKDSGVGAVKKDTKTGDSK